MQKVQKYYKALIAFGTPLTALLVLVSSNAEISAALPGLSEWLVVVGIPAVTGLFTLLKRNEPTVDEAAEILSRAQARSTGA